MNTRDEKLIAFEGGTPCPDIRLTISEEYAGVAVIEQGEEAVWIPKAELSEFCRILKEWAASNVEDEPGGDDA